MIIPGSKPYLPDRALKYVADILYKGDIGTDGYYTRLCSEFIENNLGARKAFMTTSCTHALEMACLLIGLGPGDEVIMPSYTFTSTANAVMLRGAVPVFAEINKHTLNIDPSDVEKKISSKTRALIPVHYAGIGCEMDKIMDIADNYKLYVIEDAAQAFNAGYREKYLGTEGHIGCFSFHSTKNFTSGEGGALLLNKEIPCMQHDAEIIRQKGTNKEQFLRGEIDRYSWISIGSGYSPSEVLMALLYSQMEDMELIAAQRERIYNYYIEVLDKYLLKGVLKVMQIPADCKPNYHIFYVMFQNEMTRNNVMQELNTRGIHASFHFIPLHSSPMGASLGYKPEDLEVTMNVSKCILRLPIYSGMTDCEMEYVASNLKEILERL